jgi:hypothetical protein
MACTGPWATAYDFATFWCVAGLDVGMDDSGLAAQAFLTDTTANFVQMGVEPAMIIQNITDGSGGYITNVTATTITATLTGGTENLWDDGDVYRMVALKANEQAQIEVYLEIAASDIHAALAAVGACDCTLSAWAAEYLKKLNVIDAAVIHACPCGRAQISDTQKGAWLEWLDRQFELLRTGAIDVCTGAMGADWPSIGWAQQSVSEFAAARIILNDMLRNR